MTKYRSLGQSRFEKLWNMSILIVYPAVLTRRRLNAESYLRTLDDVSHLLKVSDETIYSWIEKEGRPAIRTGSHFRKTGGVVILHVQW